MNGKERAHLSGKSTSWETNVVRRNPVDVVVTQLSAFPRSRANPSRSTRLRVLSDSVLLIAQVGG